MKSHIYRAFLLLSIIFTGCIKNDIPYPIVKGEITEIEFEGQLSLVINPDDLTVNVEFDETIDINNVYLTKFKVSNNSVVTPLVDKMPMKMDLSKNVILTLETYQTYVWTIKATQAIDRKVETDWLVTGEIDPENRTVVIYATADAYANRDNLTLSTLILGGSESQMTPLITEVTNFTDPVEFTVTTHGKAVVWTVTVEKSISDVITDKKPSKVRAYYAILSGKAASGGGTDVGFEYKKKDDVNYTKVNSIGSDEIIGSNVYKRIIADPATTYQYRIFQGDNLGLDVEFTTDPIPDVIPNLSLNNWSFTGSKKKTYYPYLKDETPYWITGNEGVTTFNIADSNVTPSDDSVEGEAARLESIYINSFLAKKFAAGTLYTGGFILNISNPNLSAILGRKFNGRPDKLSGKYKYTPKIIDKGDANLMGVMDRCHMYISLENWGEETVRPENPTIVAYGEFIGTENVLSYTDFNIILDYKTEEIMPTHITIFFSSSYYGETYTGGTGSLLFLDQLVITY